MRVFFSYSRQDGDFAGFFRSMVALGAPGVELWMDDRLSPGDHYPAEILAQVDACEVFVAAVSPAWAASSWCRAEVERALERRARGEAVEIVPLQVEDGGLAGTPLAGFQAVPLTRWRVDGDRVLRREFLGRFAPSPPPARPGGPLVEALRDVVLWGAQGSLPPAVGRQLADLAGWHAAASSAPPLARARLLDALAGLHLTRREWSDLEGASLAALSLVQEAGWEVPAPGGTFDGAGRDDDELGFLGELFNRLALGARQRGNLGGGEPGPTGWRGRRGDAYLEAARAVLGRIRQPLLRDEKLAQVHRELGTWAQGAGDLDGARAHFRESGRLLAALPSQRLHVAQARIKEAQVDLAEGKVAAARAHLDAVAPIFAAGRDDLNLAQVHPHFLLTDAMCRALAGDDAGARRALEAHAALAARGPGANNEGRRRQVERLLRLPVRARGLALRAALLALRARSRPP